MRPVVAVSTLAGAPLVRLDEWALPKVSIQCVVTGTVNYTVQLSLDDPNSSTNPVAQDSMNWTNSPDTAAVGATGSIVTSLGGYGTYADVFPLFVRVLVNSGSGSVTATIVQPGAVPY